MATAELEDEPNQDHIEFTDAADEDPEDLPI